MIMEEMYRPVRKEMDAVEDCLLELSRSDNMVVSEVVSRLVNAGGKRLRPALLLIGAKACGYSGERAVKLAVAVELVHTASLIHDDVVDGAGMRRGTPTVNSRWGNKVSVLVGDYLYSRMVSILAEDGDLEMIRLINGATSDMTDGEMRQTLCRRDVNLSEGDYLAVIAGKTASLISCSCRVGGMLGEHSNGEVDALARYGQSLGMAFQISDDVLDLIGREETVRKTVRRDIVEGNVTLPLIHALSVASEDERGGIARAFRAEEGDVPDRVIELVTRHGGIEYSLEKARGYALACRQEVKGLRESACRDSLDRIAGYVVERVC